ncbi:cytochrome P450 monooxygenase easK [Aspergillus fumigatus Af293]|uniref:Cytochrome P450 monooxygenase easK n=3 Tax=Aspergillus fumigatus TaxID=746128 RepID=EASK_ASPFU|nr:cytochrome P450 monooxygenase, putative [Aspergillus fumigatus Af293]Q4WZ68.1 RecName: Full=Cytochrome P450 monooxygenase easK; AltName: Full=Ergot alkaloid synthesis protein K; Flags: Precursor [Aspergillus fumigatus Af293]EAL94097.1 cytochrome P450 monooxygenase, putative [Aspergillus fumigatus Af293]EDP55301.1 cytochrome P450 monooxygenase, putative [Aspergillus fumigatus A1163]KEY80395.1 cytochrome P450 monooxygenase [Aspergillus fumigatus]
MLLLTFTLPVVTLLLAHIIRSWFRLRHIPGPFWAKITDLWREHHYIKGDYGDRPMAPYFAIPSLLGMESAMDQIQQELEDQICRRVTIDVVLWMRLFSLESLHWIAFSNKLGYLSEGKDTDGILSILQSKFIGLAGQLCGWIHRTTLRFHFPKSCTGTAVAPSQRKASHRDLLAHFMDASQKNPETLEERGVLGATISTIFAGTDTTGTSLTFFMYYLIKHPAALARLQEELDSAVRSGNLSYPPKWVEVSTLKYLQAVFKETLRLHSTARMSLYRVVGPEGLDLCGERLPSGTNLGCFGYTAHRNEPIYGRDAALFRPERWIEASNDTLLSMERASL